MLILCNKCNNTTDARLHRKTEKVICMSCGEEITAVTAQTINALKNMKEYIEEKKQSFSFLCNKCGERKPALVAHDGTKVVCVSCGEEVRVSLFMKQIMKDLGYYQS